jgi:hypothetical protein
MTNTQASSCFSIHTASLREAIPKFSFFYPHALPSGGDPLNFYSQPHTPLKAECAGKIAVIISGNLPKGGSMGSMFVIKSNTSRREVVCDLACHRSAY